MAGAWNWNLRRRLLIVRSARWIRHLGISLAVAMIVAPIAEATIIADRHHLYRNSTSAQGTWLILDQSMACRHRSPANTCWQHAVSAWNPLTKVELSHSAGTGTSCPAAAVNNGTCPTNNLMTTVYSQDYGASGWAGMAWWWYGEWTIDGQPHRHLFKGFSVNNTTSAYTKTEIRTTSATKSAIKSDSITGTTVAIPVWKTA